MSSKRGLVVGGGGARGAWAVGALWYLMKDRDERYDMVVGTSTGSLIAPMAAIGDIEHLKENYVNITWREALGTWIPTRSETLNGVWALLTGKDSIYTSKPLHESILNKHLTPDHWAKLQDPDQSADVWVCTVDIRTGEKRYFGARDPGMTREKFASAMMASCSIPVLMSKARIIGEPDWFLDGGVKEMVPLDHIVQNGASEVRIISMGVDPLVDCGEYPHLLDVALRTAELAEEETSANDLALGRLISLELDWRDRLRDRLSRKLSAAEVDASFAETSAEREPLMSAAGPYRRVTFRVLSPRCCIGPTHKFNPTIMAQYFADGYKFASARDEMTGAPEVNWRVIPEPLAGPGINRPVR